MDDYIIWAINFTLASTIEEVKVLLQVSGLDHHVRTYTSGRHSIELMVIYGLDHTDQVNAVWNCLDWRMAAWKDGNNIYIPVR